MFDNHDNEPEKIVCAAIWFKNFPSPQYTVKNVEGLVMCGFRHGYIISQFYLLTNKSLAKAGPSVQGFLTSKNRFVDRSEAIEIYRSCGLEPEYENELYSEDLY